MSSRTEMHHIAQNAFGEPAVVFGAQSSYTVIRHKINRALTVADLQRGRLSATQQPDFLADVQCGHCQDGQPEDA
jgi:hypothetical protein